jgi:hypothetical protein
MGLTLAPTPLPPTGKYVHSGTRYTESRRTKIEGRRVTIVAVSADGRRGKEQIRRKQKLWASSYIYSLTASALLGLVLGSDPKLDNGSEVGIRSENELDNGGCRGFFDSIYRITCQNPRLRIILEQRSCRSFEI